MCVNFAQNTSFEANENGWKYADWGGTVTGTHSRVTDFSLFGNASYKFAVTKTTGGAGARIYQDYTAPYVKAGATYTLSAYVKTVDVQASGKGGACVAFYINSEQRIKYGLFRFRYGVNACGNKWRLAKNFQQL